VASDRVVGIHQPEYLPWMGFLNKLANSDVFVLLDNVQYRRNYFQNRNRIRTSEGWTWLTVPVKKAPLETVISEIQVDGSKPWGESHWKSLKQNYSKSKYFDEYSEFFNETYLSNWRKLADLNSEIIRFFAKAIGTRCEIIRASNLHATGTSTDLLLQICQELDADIYLSGRFGRDYLNEELFREAEIKVVYQDFKHPEYEQVYKPFVPAMAGIDLLFNGGAESIEYIRRGWVLADRATY
jgi:hypothetical protein